MGLTCSCSDFEPEPGDWYYDAVPTDFTTYQVARRKRCCSCKELISINEPALKFTRVRVPKHDVEVEIYGECGEIPIADHWLCERCGGLYLSLSELGYCVNPQEDMRELVAEYAAEQEWARQQSKHKLGEKDENQ